MSFYNDRNIDLAVQASFGLQMHNLIDMGYKTDEALDVVSKDLKDKLPELEVIANEVKEGKNLDDAIRERGSKFHPLLPTFVEFGLNAGILDSTLKNYAELMNNLIKNNLCSVGRDGEGNLSGNHHDELDFYRSLASVLELGGGIVSDHVAFNVVYNIADEHFQKSIKKSLEVVPQSGVTGALKAAEHLEAHDVSPIPFLKAMLAMKRDKGTLYNPGHVLNQFCDMIVRYHELRFGEEIKESKAATVTFYRYLGMATEYNMDVERAIGLVTYFAYNFIDDKDVPALKDVARESGLSAAISHLSNIQDVEIKTPLFAQRMIQRGEDLGILDTALYRVADALEKVYLLETQQQRA